MTREEARVLLKYLNNQLTAEFYDGGFWVEEGTFEAFEVADAALRGPQPDPDTGLVPCGWCGPERIGWFSVQFWVRASTGKRKWMSVTQKYKKQVNYCPMCGRKLEEANENEDA